ncbi:MAG: tetratricopeptide repeat protein, partial [Acidobacteria bacterium]|nr:tetratricopeptide repeat protein [Acidobacteriota bacterium]
MWSLERNTFILLIFLTLIIMFVITGFIVKAYHAKEKALAEEWYLRGEAELKAGRANEAIEDLRTALTYSRDNSLYVLVLAQALGAANRQEEARAYLLSLWEEEPGNETVNLELGRSAVKQGRV